MHAFRMPSRSSEHKRRLVVFVQSIYFVAEREQDANAREETEGGGEVQGGVGEAGGGRVRVVEEVGVGF